MGDRFIPKVCDVRKEQQIADLSAYVAGTFQRLDVLVNDAGGIIDDLLVYRITADEYLLVVNAATTEKDYAWIAAHAEGTLRGQLREALLGGPALRDLECGGHHAADHVFAFQELGRQWMRSRRSETLAERCVALVQ